MRPRSVGQNFQIQGLKPRADVRAAPEMIDLDRGTEVNKAGEVDEACK
jgi:hypothetical protein